MDKSRRKLKPIAKKRRNFVFFLLAVLFAILTGYIFFTFPPDHKFKILKVGISIVPIFLASFFFFLYSTLRFIIIKKVQAVLISGLLFSYLLLRLFGLTHWIFTVLFLSLFVVIELLIIKKK